MSKITDILGDIIHTACVAELNGDEAIQKQALGDIYDAIASVLPVDHARLARGASPTVSDRAAPIQPDTPSIDGRACRSATAEDGKVVVYKTPQHVLDFIAEIANVPFADMADPALLKKVAETHRLVPNTPRIDGRACRHATAEDGIHDCGNGKKYIRISLPNGFAFAAFVAGHKIAAMGRTMPGGSEAEIYNDGVCELTMRSTRGKAYLYRVVRETMAGVVSRAGKCARHRKNVSARTGEEG